MGTLCGAFHLQCPCRDARLDRPAWRRCVLYGDVGLLVLRIAVGGVVLAHGLQKFGLLGGRGLGGVSETMRGLGFSPPALWAVIVGMAETGGGLLMVLGFLGPVGPGLVAADLAVAIATIYRPQGFWYQDGRYEFVACLVGAAVANALLGHGALSFDAALGLVTTDRFAPAWLGLMAIGAAAALVGRSSRPHGSTDTLAADRAGVATAAKKRGARMGRARRR